MYISTHFDKGIFRGNCREDCRGKSNGFLEHGFMKYPIDQTNFLREEIEANNKIINHLFTLKLSLHDEQNFCYKNVQINNSSNKVNNKTVFHNYSPKGPCFKENSNELNENIFNKFHELNDSTLKATYSQLIIIHNQLVNY